MDRWFERSPIGPGAATILGEIPSLHPAGLTSPGLFAPTRRDLSCECRADMTLIWSCTGIPSATLTMRGTSFSIASIIASAARSGGTKTAVACGLTCLTACEQKGLVSADALPIHDLGAALAHLFHAIKDGPFQMCSSTLAWADPADDVGAHVQGELGVEGALPFAREVSVAKILLASPNEKQGPPALTLFPVNPCTIHGVDASTLRLPIVRA